VSSGNGAAGTAALPKDGVAQRILTAAHDLFYREGIRAVGVDRLIAESGVAKRTFYRHFPTKQALVLAFLEHRHERWMTMFETGLEAQPPGPQAVVGALARWFSDPAFRGCAFINAVAELGDSFPEAIERSRLHKQAMVEAIAARLTPGPRRAADARALAMAADGAIVAVQFGQPATEVLAQLSRLAAGLDASA